MIADTARQTNERAARLVEAVDRRFGGADWGDVLAVGCEDSSLLPAVAARARNLVVELEAAGRAYDVVLVSLGEIGGGVRRRRHTLARAAEALRSGGLLVLDAPELHAGRRLRDLERLGLEILPLWPLGEEDGLTVLTKAVFPDGPGLGPIGLRRFVPSRARALYRALRFARNVWRQLDWRPRHAAARSLMLLRVLWRVRERSLVSPGRLAALARLAAQVDDAGTTGDFVECGVYRGGSAAVLAHVAARSREDRDLWLFDSFSGLPEPTPKDGPAAPALAARLATDADEVRRFVAKAGMPEERLHVVEGWFEQTFPAAPVERVAFLHIDADWYASIKLALDRFYPLLEPGGVVVLDDYGDWPGCERALDDFCRERSLGIQLRGGGVEPVHFRKAR